LVGTRSGCARSRSCTRFHHTLLHHPLHARSLLRRPTPHSCLRVPTHYTAPCRSCTSNVVFTPLSHAPRFAGRSVPRSTLLWRSPEHGLISEPLAAHSALRALATRRLHSGVDTCVAAHWRAAAAAAAVARPYRPSARDTRAVMTLTARRDADSVPHSTVSASLFDGPAQAQAQRRSCGNRKLVSAGAGGSVHRLPPNATALRPWWEGCARRSALQTRLVEQHVQVRSVHLVRDVAGLTSGQQCLFWRVVSIAAAPLDAPCS
jgi:hypothetical protein